MIPSTSSRRSRTVVLTALLLLFSSPSATIHAGDETFDLPDDFDSLMAEIDKTFGGMAERQKQTIHRALFAFQKNTRYGDDWNRTVSSIKLEVPWDLGGDQKADAVATEEEDEQRHVALNQMLMFAIIDDSLAAARYLVRDATGAPWRELEGDATNSLWIEIEGNVVAWALAHEIAHHLAGNVNAKPPSLTASREWELAADVKAFEILDRSGFSLYLLSRYMKVMERVQRLNLRVGKGNPESLSSHPHWSTRVRAVEQYMDSHPPENHRWIVYTSLSHKPGEIEPTLVTYMVPGNDLEHLAFLTYGESMVMVGVERKPDNSAVVYIRDGADVYRQRILDLSKHATTVRVVAAGGSTIDQLCFRGSFAGTAMGDAGGQISKALAYDAVARIRRGVAKANIGSVRRREAEQLFIQRARALQDHILDFYRGAVSPEQYQARLLETSEQYDARLRASLGEQEYDRINRLIVGDLAGLIGSP